MYARLYIYIYICIYSSIRNSEKSQFLIVQFAHYSEHNTSKAMYLRLVHIKAEYKRNIYSTSIN